MQLTLDFAKTSKDPKYNAAVELGVALTEAAISQKYSGQPLAASHALKDIDYRNDSKELRKLMFEYCADKAGIDDFDAENTDQCKEAAVQNEKFLKELFALQGAILNSINTANTVEEALVLANVDTIGWGDSKTYSIGSKGLPLVQDQSYGANVSRYQREFFTDITIKPSPKVIAISYDVFQMMALDYDWAGQIAKVAMAMRARLYQDVIDVIYTTANLNNTPFYKPNFAKTTYIENVERLAGANSASVRAFGTRMAFAAISDTVDRGFNVQDDYVKAGYIADLYGVPSVILRQAVDPTSSSYVFRVPNDRILLLPMVGDRPVKVVIEGGLRIRNETGEGDSIRTASYLYEYSWGAALATQCSYGIQGV